MAGEIRTEVAVTKGGHQMKRFLAAGLVAALLVALAVMVAFASTDGPASAAQYQYRGKASLTLSVANVTSSSYTVHLDGSGYFSGSQPGGQLQLTCGGKKGSACGTGFPITWNPGGVGGSGNFSTDVFTFSCGTNVRSAVAVGNDGVKSNAVKGAC